MISEPNITVFYSSGVHFLRTARALRQRHEAAAITAFVPKDFPEELLSSLNIRCLPLLPNPSQKRSLKHVATILRAIRGMRPDVFIVLFDSPKLRTLAALSGAGERLCYHPDGRITPMRWSFAGFLARSFMQAFRGRLRYTYIWCHVHFTRVDRSMVQKPSISDLDFSDTDQDTGV